MEDVDLGLINENEVSKGMREMYFRHFQWLSSEMALEPADANYIVCRFYLSRLSTYLKKNIIVINKLVILKIKYQTSSAVYFSTF